MAIVVGVDYYVNMPALFGCVSDALAVKGALERHADGGLNFDVKLLTGTGPKATASRDVLKDLVHDLFKADAEIALFYFAGHGHMEVTGGYLCASDCRMGDDGLALSDVITLANQSQARNKIIILDSCHSGAASINPLSPPGRPISELTEGMSILTASTVGQYSKESNGSGVFTSLLVDALNGAAANLVGDVTPGSVYAHIDQSLGPWDQRPVFKTNVKTFVSLRRVRAPLLLTELRRITEFFPEAGMDFPLNPTFEPRRSGTEPPDFPAPDPVNTEKFAVLQKLNRVNLVVPVREEHMYYAAWNSTACRLTPLGEHYRRLVQRGRI
jgi:hypothetical protein